MKSIISILLSLMAIANAVELDSTNFDELTAGKTVFIKFLAPWCGHCKNMKPDWDKLMDAFADSKDALVADVDCTAAGKELCSTHGVKGYPTLKWGDPANLEDYKGGRDYDSLYKFASANLKPICSPANIDLCDADKKAEIEKYLAMDSADLGKLIDEAEKKVEDAETAFKDGVAELQNKYQELMANKEKTQEEIKNAGLGLMKACKNHAGKKGSDEL